jgi:hypothetical protein
VAVERLIAQMDNFETPCHGAIKRASFVSQLNFRANDWVLDGVVQQSHKQLTRLM